MFSTSAVPGLVGTIVVIPVPQKVERIQWLIPCYPLENEICEDSGPNSDSRSGNACRVSVFYCSISLRAIAIFLFTCRDFLNRIP